MPKVMAVITVTNVQSEPIKKKRDLEHARTAVTSLDIQPWKREQSGSVNVRHFM